MNRFLAAGLLLLLSSPAFAGPPITVQDDTHPNRTLVINSDGSINVNGGVGGGGTGDASAANQTTQITAEQAIQATLGAKTDAKSTATDTTSISAMQVLKQLSAYLAGMTPPAQGAAISGQTPSTVACQALTANPTAYTTATTNPVTCDEYGASLTRPYSLGAGLVQGTTSAMTGTASTSLVAAPGSGLRNYITNITCVNSHATVGTFITVQDGSGGTALYTLAAASVFGGAVVNFPAPLRQPTTNTALYVADVTTGANVICSASGYKAP